MADPIEEQIASIREAILGRKGIDPVVLDVRGLSGVTDFFVIASATGAPHLKALSAAVSRALRAASVRRRSAGTAESGWVVLDGLDVVVHLMTRELRERYALEALWSDAPRLPVEDPEAGCGSERKEG